MKKEQRTIPVHALGDERVHLALPHHGRLRQGRLKTLCDKLAVSELPLFATIEAKSRCRLCFSRVNEHGYLKEADTVAEPEAPQSKRSARVIPLTTKKKTSARTKD